MQSYNIRRILLRVFSPLTISTLNPNFLNNFTTALLALPLVGTWEHH